MIVQQSILFDKISTQFISFFNYALICFFLWNFYSHTAYSQLRQQGCP